MPDPMLVSLAVGVVSNLPLAVLMQPWWPRWFRVAFAYVVCLAAGAEIAAAAGQLHVPHSAADAVTLFGDVAAVLIASQAVYGGLNKAGILDAIEHATDVSRIPVPRVALRSPLVLGSPAPVVSDSAPAIVGAPVVPPVVPVPTADPAPAAEAQHA